LGFFFAFTRIVRLPEISKGSFALQKNEIQIKAGERSKKQWAQKQRMERKRNNTPLRKKKKMTKKSRQQQEKKKKIW